MKRMIKAAVTAAGSLGVIGTVLTAGAAPALAAPMNTAYGAAAVGILNLAPVAVATPMNTAAVASNANLGGLLATGVIQDRADYRGATSQLSQGIVLTLPRQGKLTATGLRSWCVRTGPFTFGAANIYSGAILQVGQATITLPVSPPANDVLSLPNGVTITLNKQVRVAGVLTVTAIQAQLPGQLVKLGVSSCVGRMVD